MQTSYQTSESHYQCAGIMLSFVYATQNQVTQIEQHWHDFFALKPVTMTPCRPDITFHWLDEDAPFAQPMLVDTLISDDYSVMGRTVDGLCLQVGSAWFTQQAADKRTVHGMIGSTFWQLPLAVQREFFLRSLLIMLGPHARYGLHANGVIQGDGGLLLIGPSGSGKTTLTLSLLQSGWQSLGDDAVLLQKSTEGVIAHTLQRGFACTPQTLSFYPHLYDAVIQELDPIRHKQQVDLTEVFSDQLATEAKPRALLFPTINGNQSSSLKPLGEVETLFRLIEQSAGIFINRNIGAEQLDLLRDLVKQAPGYQLQLGHDVYRQPDAIAVLLADLAIEVTGKN